MDILQPFALNRIFKSDTVVLNNVEVVLVMKIRALCSIPNQVEKVDINSFDATEGKQTNKQTNQKDADQLATKPMRKTLFCFMANK